MVKETEQQVVPNEDDFLEFLQEEEKNWLKNRAKEAEGTGLSAEAAEQILELHKEAMGNESACLNRNILIVLKLQNCLDIERENIKKPREFF